MSNETRPRLAEAVRANAGAPNTLAWIREKLGDEAGDLDELLADRGVPAVAIYRELAEREFTVTESAVQNWCRKARLRADHG